MPIIFPALLTTFWSCDLYLMDRLLMRPYVAYDRFNGYSIEQYFNPQLKPWAFAESASADSLVCKHTPLGTPCDWESK